MPEFEVGGRVFGGDMPDGKVASAIVAAFLANAEGEIFALVPKALVDHGTDGLFIDRVRKVRFTAFHPIALNARSPADGAFGAIRVATNIELSELTRAYTTKPARITESVDLGGFAGAVVALRQSVVVSQGYGESSAFIVACPGGKEEEHLPIVGELCLTHHGAAGAVYGVSQGDRRVAIAPFGAILERFAAEGLHLAQHADLAVHNAKFWQERERLPPLAQQFSAWMARHGETEGWTVARTTEELGAQIWAIPTLIDLDDQVAPITLGLSKQPFWRLLDGDPILSQVVYDLDRSRFIETSSGFHAGNSFESLRSLIELSFQEAQREGSDAA